MDFTDFDAVMAEHRRRSAVFDVPFNPLLGDELSPLRMQVSSPVPESPLEYVPRTMVDDPAFATVQHDPTAWKRLRCRHDFEYWCATCATVKHKIEASDVRFVLNRPQRRVAAILEQDRLAGKPLRLIMLKARQWGGSTLVQTYMAWIQSCHRCNWHSIICSQVKDTSTGIRGMYTKLLDNYPRELWEGDEEPRFRPYERSTNVREIAGRGCRVTVASVENQDAVRGADFAMAHLSETAFWRATPQRSPEDVIRAVCGAIALMPMSLVVMESTANGTGNFFHSEWIRCRDGRGDKRAVFVPWYEIEIYRLRPDSYRELIETLSPYEQELWEVHGCDLDQINWYRHKNLEYSSRDKMMAEFPTTDTEAFAATSSCIFATAHIEALRPGCRAGVRGELAGGRFIPSPHGLLQVWQMPHDMGCYIAAVDIGGRTDRADWSVIAVLRIDGDIPEVVAQWRGHIDHDILADTAMDIAYWYKEALLVVESNSLENGAGLFVLNRLADMYFNIYRRRGFDSINGLPTDRVGFHTNRQTKEMAVTTLLSFVRRGAYIERDTKALDEMLSYEQTPEGIYAAIPGKHDDILMTRAIALHVAATDPPPLPIQLTKIPKHPLRL